MKKNIFIAFTIQNSAVSNYYLKLADLLSENFEVCIFTSKTNIKIDTNLQKYRIFYWPNDRPTQLKDFLFLAKKVNKYRPVTMISTFGAVNMFSIVGKIFFIKNRLAWVHSLSTHSFTRKIMLYRKSMVYKLCTTVIANSSATKNDLVNNFFVNPKKIKVVYNSIDTPEDIQATINSKKITFAGRIHPSKGIDTLIKAMAVVVKKYPEVKLDIVGAFLKGETIKKYLVLTKELDLENHINFLGWKSKPELLQCFKNSYFTVVPSVSEAFGYVVIESFSVKTPVIGSNTGGIAEIIRDGKDGFLFTPRDHKELAEKMMHLLSDNQLRERFSESCYSRFLDNFQTVKVLQKFVSYIHHLS